MRTMLEVDSELLRAAMQATGLSQADTVEESLRRLVVADDRHKAIMNVVGIEWVGDLDEMRRGH